MWCIFQRIQGIVAILHINILQMLRQHNSHEAFDNAYLFYLTTNDTIKVTLLKILFLYVFVEHQKLSQTGIIIFFTYHKEA